MDIGLLVTGSLCLVSRRYEARVQAGTVLGCAAGDWASVQTPEAPPLMLMQPPPRLEVQMAPGGFQPTVSPNEKVLHYELYRRQPAAQPGRSQPGALTYNGSSSLCVDSELLPFTEYEYQVRTAYPLRVTARLGGRPRRQPVQITCDLKTRLKKRGTY